MATKIKNIITPFTRTSSNESVGIKYSKYVAEQLANQEQEKADKKTLRLKNERETKRLEDQENIFGSIASIGTQIGGGFTQAIENIVIDAPSLIAGNVADLFDNQGLAKSFRDFADYDITGTMLNAPNKAYDPYAGDVNIGGLEIGFASNEIGGQLIKSTSQALTTGLIGMKTGSMGGALFASGYGQATTEEARRLKELELDREPAELYGLGYGALTTGLELLSGGNIGLGKGPVDDAIIDNLKSAFSSNVGRKGFELFTKAGLESAEEVIEGIIDPYLRRATVDEKAEYYTMQQAGVDAASAFVVSGALQGVNFKNMDSRTKKEIELEFREFVKNEAKKDIYAERQSKPYAQATKVGQPIIASKIEPEITIQRAEVFKPTNSEINDLYNKEKNTVKENFFAIGNKWAPIEKIAENYNINLIHEVNGAGNVYGEANYITKKGGEQRDADFAIMGEGTHSALKTVYDNKNEVEFKAYIEHKMNLDRALVDKNVRGYTLEQSKAAIKELETKFPDFKDANNRLQKIFRNELDLAHKEGLMTDESYLNVKEAVDNYIPLLAKDDGGKGVFYRMGETLKTKNPFDNSKKVEGVELKDLDESLDAYFTKMRKTIRRNRIGKELAEVFGSKKYNKYSKDDFKAIQENEGLFVGDNKDYFYNYFEKGEMYRVKIPQDVYESLSPRNVFEFKGMAGNVQNAIKVANQTINRTRTSLSVLFPFKNVPKDVGDALINTKNGSLEFIKNADRTYKEIVNNSAEWQNYQSTGASVVSSLKNREGFGDLPIKFLSAVEVMNNYGEQFTRFNEFLLSRDSGKSILASALDADEVSLNFKKGSDLSKIFNNDLGVSFFNAGMVGFNKFINNFSGLRTAKAITQLMFKFAVAGIGPQIFNEMLYGDDEEYQKLTDREKDNNFIIMSGDKAFKIPTGRMVNVFSAAARRTVEAAQGNRDFSEIFDKGYLEVLGGVTPGNVIDSHILAPLYHSKQNKTWYGGDIVPQRLEDLEPKLQYDEYTTNVAKFIGNITGQSPKKIDYIMKQYSGDLGRLVMPLLTEAEGEQGVLSSFYTDTTFKNQISTDFYNLLGDLKSDVAKGGSNEDLKHMNRVIYQLNQLYSEKRAIQTGNSKDKYQEVIEVQNKINNIQQEAIEKIK